MNPGLFTFVGGKGLSVIGKLADALGYLRNQQGRMKGTEKLIANHVAHLKSSSRALRSKTRVAAKQHITATGST